MDYDLDALTSFVNEQIDFHERLLAQSRENGDERRALRHQSVLIRYRQILSVFEEVGERQSKDAPHRLALTWEEVHDLPPDLMKELSVSEGDRLEFDMLRILEDHGGVASLDRFLVELYRRNNEIYQRTWLNNKLYRMMQKEMIHSVPGKKGVYSLEPLDKETAADLI